MWRWQSYITKSDGHSLLTSQFHVTFSVTFSVTFPFVPPADRSVVTSPLRLHYTHAGRWVTVLLFRGRHSLHSLTSWVKWVDPWPFCPNQCLALVKVSCDHIKEIKPSLSLLKFAEDREIWHAYESWHYMAITPKMCTENTGKSCVTCRL